MRVGYISRQKKISDEKVVATTKSERSEHDQEAPLGRGATNTLERIAASVGALQAVTPCFEPAVDIPMGGVLLAIPALLASGLLQHTSKHFELPKGYYGLESIFLLLALIALARLKSLEALRYCAPGEWGKLLGLDRIPEVKTLRSKVDYLSRDNQSKAWGETLSAQWMFGETQASGIFYADGHVRVYHGHQTKLPHHYVTREKLCLRATCDYWVNALDGQPFFYVNQAVDPGLVKVLEGELLPRIEKDMPERYTKEELDADPLLHRFTLIFDREGYSPDLMLRLKRKRIASITYHKYPDEDWPIEEFTLQKVELVGGAIIEAKLAERGTYLSKKLWVREIRKLSDTGHQTSIIATDYKSSAERIAVWMVNRWCQENFFKYMRNHYNLDRLVNYDVESIPETVQLVNPAYRALDSQVRSYHSRLNRLMLEFAALHLEGDITPENMEPYQNKKASLQEAITHLQQETETLKTQRKETPRHITVGELPEEKRFSRLDTQTKHFIDTIKLLAYRAETMMVNVLREKMSRHDDARSLACSIYKTEVDLLPNEKEKTLTVKIHALANQSSDVALQYLSEEMTATETVFPGTDLKLIYQIVSRQNP